MKEGTSSLRVLCWKQDVSLVLHWKGPSVQPYRSDLGILSALQTYLFFSRTAGTPRLSPHACLLSMLGANLQTQRLQIILPKSFFSPSYSLCHVAAHKINVFMFVFEVYLAPSRKASKSAGTFAGAFLPWRQRHLVATRRLRRRAGPFGGNLPPSPERGRAAEGGSVDPLRSPSRVLPRAAPRATGAPRDRLLARIASEWSTVHSERGSMDPNHRFCTAEMPCNP